MDTPKPNSAQVGMVGLGVMGRNLSLNIADHGFRIAGYDRDTAATDKITSEHAATAFPIGGGFIPAPDVKSFVASIQRPRRIVLLVTAGRVTDAAIDGLTPLLEPGDCIIDGGNSEWEDTERREAAAVAKGLLYVGSGVSGGEEGARFGPSLMPGGKREAWDLIKPIWLAIAARVDERTGKPLTGARPGHPVSGGVPCAAYIGPGGSGHYVKMVHNGIEYSDMQLICEAYHFMRDVLAMSTGDMAATFANWNTGELDSFLIEITADILRQKDPVTGRPFVDVVLDAAGQKGTGKWTINSALDLGQPAATMAEAVFARNMSALKEERQAAAKVLSGPHLAGNAHVAGPQGGGGHNPNWVDCVRDALYCSKICSYAQGFALMAAQDRARSWGLSLGEVASIFRGGCIIRARFLQKITEAFERRTDLPNLLLDPYFAGTTSDRQQNWRAVVARAAVQGVPVPAFGSALAYFDSYRSPRLPANLLQAQRDYFGSHTYERTDQPRGKFFHVDWPDPKRPQSAVN
ncbi:MAG: NADP-dependent phosphogluconate dehydrogenase [Phycisphaerales bacterium]|nr:NADP-dependent phosphogluconate dehydrogenase [Phycisphaerales bacterium]